MLVIQQNYGKKYKYIISALEAGLGLEASIVYIQEPFLRNQSLAYIEYNLYWPSRIDNRKDIWIMICDQKRYT